MLNNVKKITQDSFDLGDDYIWDEKKEEDSEESVPVAHTDGIVAEALVSTFFKCKGYHCVGTEPNDVVDLILLHPSIQGSATIQVKGRSLISEDAVRLRHEGPNVDGKDTLIPYNIGDFDYLAAVIGCYIWVIPSWCIEKPGGTYATYVGGFKKGHWDRWRHNFHDAVDDYNGGEIKPLSFDVEF